MKIVVILNRKQAEAVKKRCFRHNILNNKNIMLIKVSQ